MTLHFSLSSPFPVLKKRKLAMGGKNPQGTELGVTSRYWEKNGEPVLPIMGELHYSRVPVQNWETELCKMKALGIQVVSSYHIWLHHEPKKGQFCFSGNCDARRFVQLCQKCGLLFVARIGPWAHGEVRNGGFPDYVTHLRTRTNDPDYLMAVRGYFTALFGQLEGLFWKDGGPIVAVQIENELANQPEHLALLKDMAWGIGFEAPFYTITGWAPNRIAQFPQGEFLPLFGTYPEAPWEQHTDPLNPGPFFAPVPGRNDSSIGSDSIRSGQAEQSEAVLEHYPYGTCEVGPGIQVTYHRRPVIGPKDCYAASMMMLAKGCSLLGYYMFHGGRNPLGGFYQESRRTGYPNDLPVISYDFQTALSEFGQLRETGQYLKLCNQTAQFPSLAAFAPLYPKEHLQGVWDAKTPRALFRGNEQGGGLLFLNTYQRTARLSPISDFQAQFQQANGQVGRVPLEPVAVPEGISAAFPVHLSLGGIPFDYILATPLLQCNTREGEVVVLAAADGVPSEFCLSEEEAQKLKGLSGKALSAPEGTRRFALAPGRDCCFWTEEGDRSVRFFLLPFSEALRLYCFSEEQKRPGFSETEKLYSLWLSDSCLFQQDGRIFVESNGEQWIWQLKGQRFVSSYIAGEPSPSVQLQAIPFQPERYDSEALSYLFSPNWEGICCRRLILSSEALSHVTAGEDVLLSLLPLGDVLQLYAVKEGHALLIWDQFCSGTLAVLSLGAFRQQLEGGYQLELVLTPLRPDTNLYLERHIPRGKALLTLEQVSVMERLEIG